MSFKKYLINLLKEHKKQEVYGVLVTLLCSFSVFVTPYLSKYLIDNVVKFKTRTEMYPVLLIFLGVCFLQPVFNYFRCCIFVYIAEKINLDVRTQLFAKVIFAPFSFFNKTAKGDILSRIVGDGGGISSFVTTFWAVIVNSSVFLLMSIVGMFLLSPLISSILLGLVVIYVLFNIYVGKIFEKIAAKSLILEDKFYTTLEQQVDNIELIKTFVAEKKVNKQYVSVLKELQALNIESGKRSPFYSGISSTIILIAIAVIYWMGFGFILEGKMTIGTVIALEVYFQMLVNPIHELIESVISYWQILPTLKRLNEYFELPVETLTKTVPVQIKASPAIIFKDVTFGYVSNSQIFNNLNLEFHGSGLYGIVGPSGIGKSTIAKLLTGLYAPTKGVICVYPDDQVADSVEAVRLNVGYVAQHTELFNVSFRENILLGCSNSIRDSELIAICERLNLHEKINNLPDKYDTVVSESINLSGGEMQRVAIARAYLKNAPINIFDEVTSFLDEVNTQNVVDIINEMKQKGIVILLTHKLLMLADAKKVINLGEQ
ncbi:MAG: ABC transporter ATP-binding protein/permease [Oscillospiraceae bacterium]|jgi:ABC-type bacteriocin/lantibiotic exporter with double-glycine peptidase domain|nr:ABC transporter ATP-binding protein/permease [Oscillospiraceae bacterium]